MGTSGFKYTLFQHLKFGEYKYDKARIIIYHFIKRGLIGLVNHSFAFYAGEYNELVRALD
jgi:hypothetical protein